MYHPWQDDPTARAHIYIYISVYTHVYVFVHVFLQGEAWPFCSPQVAHPWSAFRRCCCALTQKLTHHQEGQAYTSPPLRSASALQMRRQTGNESCCALVNELITLRRHCQFCFCSAWSQYLSESGCNFRVAARAFQEDMFLDKSKVLEYSSTQLGFSLSLSFFNSVCDILWTFFLSLLNGCQWGTDTFFPLYKWSHLNSPNQKNASLLLSSSGAAEGQGYRFSQECGIIHQACSLFI